MGRARHEACVRPTDYRECMNTSYAGREALLRAIASSWSADTSNDPQLWSPDNPALGQCAVTALVVQDYLGGGLLRGMVGEVSHYWNALPGGSELDLTRQQFENPSLQGVSPRSRDYVLSNVDTRRRYHALSTFVSNRLRPSAADAAVVGDWRDVV